MKFILLFISVACFISISRQATVQPHSVVPASKKCYECLNQVASTTESFACIDSWESQTGSCCNPLGSLSKYDNFCTNGPNTLCSNRVKQKSKFSKYAFCPFERQKCYQKPLISTSYSSQNVAATTLAFAKEDVCSWKLVPNDSELYFQRVYNITINKVNDMTCKLIWGDSIDAMDNEADCSEINVPFPQIMSNQHLWIVAIGKNDKAYLQFTYSTVDYLPIYTTGAALAGAIFILASSVGCLILFILTKSTDAKLGSSENQVKENGVIISIEMNKARAAFNEIQRREGRPMQADPMAVEQARYSPIGNQIEYENDNYATANKNTLGNEENSDVQLLKDNQKMMKQMNQMLMTKMMRDIQDSLAGKKPKRQSTHVHKHHRSPTRKPRDYKDRGGRDEHRDDRNEYGRQQTNAPTQIAPVDNNFGLPVSQKPPSALRPPPSVARSRASVKPLE